MKGNLGGGTIRIDLTRITPDELRSLMAYVDAGTRNKAVRGEVTVHGSIRFGSPEITVSGVDSVLEANVGGDVDIQFDVSSSGIETGICLMCGRPAERGPSGAWWHLGESCFHVGQGTARFRLAE